jgi:hypothetical protein
MLFVNFLRSVLKCRFQDNFFSQNFKKKDNVKYRYIRSLFLSKNITSLSWILSVLRKTLTHNAHFNCRLPFYIQDLLRAVAPSSVRLALLQLLTALMGTFVINTVSVIRHYIYSTCQGLFYVMCYAIYKSLDNITVRMLLIIALH